MCSQRPHEYDIQCVQFAEVLYSKMRRILYDMAIENLSIGPWFIRRCVKRVYSMNT